MSGYGTVLIIRRQTRNSDGDLLGAGEDRVLGAWEIAPQSSTETATGIREETTDRLQAYGGPPCPDIRSGDRVYLQADDRTAPPPWSVIGTPDDWGGDEWDPGRVVTLARYRG